MRQGLLAGIALVSIAAAACGGGGGGEETATTAAASPIVTRESSPVATAPPVTTPSVDIRELELAALPEVATALAEHGATIVQADVIYADITDDGFDDAVAPASVDGTLGHIGFLALAAEGDGAALLVAEFPEGAGGIEVTMAGAAVVMTEPVPGPDDPECCPSMLRRTTYAWNGSAFAVEAVETVENPSGGGKKTSTPGEPGAAQ